ncbi:MAG: peptidoglycan-associated lipoprotein Pal [Desulfobacterales bacterium]
MKKSIWVVLVLLLVIPGLLFTASCGKKSLTADIETMKDKTKETPASPSRSQVTAPAPVVQRAPEPLKISEEEMRAREKAAAMQALMNEDVYFDYDSAALSPAAQEVLRKKAVALNKYSNISITIEGHCDERGTNEYNLALGERRAESAKKFLIDLGLAASRFTTISYGEEKPVDAGSNEEAWSKNRRAHFVLK